MYVRQHDARVQSEIARERARAAIYRRPVAFGNVLDQNAAVWYHRALTSIRKPDRETLDALNDAAAAGPEGNSETRQTLLSGPCQQVDMSALRDALRCRYCDWQLPYDTIESASGDIATRPFVAAKCLVLDGHRLAASGDAYGAVRAYLQTFAIACDLRKGDLVMDAEADMIAESALKALARLVARASTAAFLDDVSRELAQFEGDLPDAFTAVTFDRLQLMTVVSKVERLKSWALAASRLAHDEKIVNDIVAVDRVSNGPEGWRLYERMKKRVATASSPLVRESRAAEWISFMMSAEIVRQTYGAVQIAIALERVRTVVGEYPADATAVQVPLKAYGLTYHRTSDGYQLVGPRNRDTQAVVFEQPMKRVRG
jgi:hypothetical protein